jgi:molybdopterin synthase sulfur carrier subunit
LPRVVLAPHLSRHVASREFDVDGSTVSEALAAVFAVAPALRGYVLDDQGELRKHVQVFVAGELVRDREKLSDPVSRATEIRVLQALSGG